MRSWRELGFNAVQVSIGRGPRPAGEPLNLEDLLAPSAEGAASAVPLLEAARVDRHVGVAAITTRGVFTARRIGTS